MVWIIGYLVFGRYLVVFVLGVFVREFYLEFFVKGKGLEEYICYLSLEELIKDWLVIFDKLFVCFEFLMEIELNFEVFVLSFMMFRN